MRRTFAVTAVIALTASAVVACTPQQNPGPVTESFGIRVVAPDGPVKLGDEIGIIVEVVDGDGPVADEQVTFDAVAGVGTFPAGFETDITDEMGVATSLGLIADRAGSVTIRAATRETATEFEVEVIE